MLAAPGGGGISAPGHALKWPAEDWRSLKFILQTKVLNVALATMIAMK